MSQTPILSNIGKAGRMSVVQQLNAAAYAYKKALPRG